MAKNLLLPTYLHCCFPNHLTFHLLSLNLEAVELVQEARRVQIESLNELLLLAN